MDIFLSKGFGEMCKHTELALNFVQKQYFSWKTHYSQTATLGTRKKFFKIFRFLMVLWDFNKLPEWCLSFTVVKQ